MGTKFQVGVNDFATKRPEMVEEWHPKNAFGPTEVAYASGRSAWWICKTCGQEWFCSIYSRGGQGTGCPMCAKRAQRARYAVK